MLGHRTDPETINSEKVFFFQPRRLMYSIASDWCRINTFLEKWERSKKIIFTWWFFLNVGPVLPMQNSGFSFVSSHSNLEGLSWPRPWAWGHHAYICHLPGYYHVDRPSISWDQSVLLYSVEFVGFMAVELANKGGSIISLSEEYYQKNWNWRPSDKVMLVEVQH